MVEIASNDGYLLKNFVARGIPVLGIDPAAAPRRRRSRPGCRRSTSSSAATSRGNCVAEGRAADVIIANNVLAHVADLNGLVEGIAACCGGRTASPCWRCPTWST